MTGSLRVVFMGTPRIAVPVLESLLNSGADVVGVYTGPDRRSGRGRRLAPTPVKAFAESRGLSVFQTASLRTDDEERARLAQLALDAIVVAAYGIFLPSDVLALPRLGCLNLHPSLLPRHRGPSPVASAILEGDETTGVSIILLDDGVDTGPILARESVPIGPTETCEELTDRLFDLGANLLVSALESWNAGRIQPTPQDDALATLTRRLERADGRLDWSQSAESLARQVRAFTPWPGTFTTWRGKTLKILRAEPLDIDPAAPPGAVIAPTASDVAVATGDGALRILDLQLEGRRPSPAPDFLRGHQDFISSTLE